jgi:uncharacterized protein
MNEEQISQIAGELSLKPHQVRATILLLEDGATVPFIARYRKESTESLDEVDITTIRDRMCQLEELDKRRGVVFKSLNGRGLLTDELKGKIQEAESLTKLEDLYLPYKPKRRTRATKARERGLEPLAWKIFEQEDGLDPKTEATAFVGPEKGVESIEEALAGSRDIIAEWVNEDQEAREKMRSLFMDRGLFRCRIISGLEEAGAKFRDYFDLEEPVAKAPSHRVLAMRRGEKEGFLDVRLIVPEGEAFELLNHLFVKGEGLASQEVKAAVKEGYKRLLAPAMETEIRKETKKRADMAAIEIFANNLRELLLAPPLGQKRVMAIDPGMRTGCKVACLDRQGGLLNIDTLFPFRSDASRFEADEKIRFLIETYQVEAIAIGNGTGGRETERFLRDLRMQRKIPVVMVNESGASVYSASEVARSEFSDLDVSFRGAVSIGRRLMDPLAELVKIDPKSIGVGQYQHDVNQQDLRKSLDDVVLSCVNAVGVEVNTASEQILTYVSGLGPQLAKNLITYRQERGPLRSREELKNVYRFGSKAFEQAAGFLRIGNGQNPLDESAVHPESYGVVETMARDLGCKVSDLLHDKALRRRIEPQRYVSETVGMPTLSDILSELDQPGRDPRDLFETVKFREGIDQPEDLRQGMKLPGIVTNVTAFGAFVDIGVHQDGLVHVSQMADYFVSDPSDVVKVNQRIHVTVLEVDLERHRISLSMREKPAEKGKPMRNGVKKEGVKQVGKEKG